MSETQTLHFLEGDIDQVVADQTLASLRKDEDAPRFPFHLWHIIREEKPELARFMAETIRNYAEGDPLKTQEMARTVLGVISVLEATSFNEVLELEYGAELSGIDY